MSRGNAAIVDVLIKLMNIANMLDCQVKELLFKQVIVKLAFNVIFLYIKIYSEAKTEMPIKIKNMQIINNQCTTKTRFVEKSKYLPVLVVSTI